MPAQTQNKGVNHKRGPLSETPFRRRRLDIENFVSLARIVGRNEMVRNFLVADILPEKIDPSLPHRRRHHDQKAPIFGAFVINENSFKIKA